MIWKGNGSVRTVQWIHIFQNLTAHTTTKNMVAMQRNQIDLVEIHIIGPKTINEIPHPCGQMTAECTLSCTDLNNGCTCNTCYLFTFFLSNCFISFTDSTLINKQLISPGRGNSRFLACGCIVMTLQSGLLKTQHKRLYSQWALRKQLARRINKKYTFEMQNFSFSPRIGIDGAVRLWWCWTFMCALVTLHLFLIQWGYCFHCIIFCKWILEKTMQTEWQSCIHVSKNPRHNHS